MTHMYLVIQSWAGVAYHPVEVVRTTPKRVYVRVLSKGGVMLPGRRFAEPGDVVLVPQTALRDTPPADTTWCDVVESLTEAKE